MKFASNPSRNSPTAAGENELRRGRRPDVEEFSIREYPQPPERLDFAPRCHAVRIGANRDTNARTLEE